MERKAVSGMMLTLLMISMFNMLLTQLPVAEASPLTVLAVDPTNILDPPLDPGSTFLINVTVADVTNMFGYELNLTYDTSVLTAIDSGSYSPFETLFINEIDDFGGEVYMAFVTYFGDPEGFSTTEPAPIAYILFEVDSTGASVLDLHDTKISDVWGSPISHEVVDGYFYNLPSEYLSADAGIIDLTAPIGTTWTELFPIFGLRFSFVSWIDENFDGVVSASDQIGLTDPSGKTKSYYVDNVTVTIHWTWKPPVPPGFDPAEYPAAEPELDLLPDWPIQDPVGTIWHVIYPWFSRPFQITSWEDTNGVFDPSDQFAITFLDDGSGPWWAHLDLATTDLVVTEIGPPPPPPPPPESWILLATDPDEGVGTNLKAIWGQLYSDVIYFKVEHYRTWTTINDINTWIHLDADQDPSTGLPDGTYPGQFTGIGADYAVGVGWETIWLYGLEGAMLRWDPVAEWWDVEYPIYLAYLDAPYGSNVFVVGVYLADVLTAGALDCAVDELTSNWDWMPDIGHFTFQLLQIAIYTDKATYSAGDTMQLGLDVENAGAAIFVHFAIWLEKPDGSTLIIISTHVTLPAGLSYSNPTFKTFTLPEIPSGTYTWHAAILGEPTHGFLAQDTAEWEFG